jgi:hypothetical protein
VQPSKVVGLRKPKRSIFRVELCVRQQAGSAGKQRDRGQSKDQQLPASAQAIAIGECLQLGFQKGAPGVEPVLEPVILVREFRLLQAASPQMCKP